jgi:hypothetical protein
MLPAREIAPITPVGCMRLLGGRLWCVRAGMNAAFGKAHHRPLTGALPRLLTFRLLARRRRRTADVAARSCSRHSRALSPPLVDDTTVVERGGECERRAVQESLRPARAGTMTGNQQKRVCLPRSPAT